MEDNHLLLIKAAAGSGKTHRLTGEYLRLLFDDANKYRHILAVTFTNKATDEMKTRIIEELYKLSIGAKSGYLDELKEEFGLKDDEVSKKAKVILENVLHDYSAFAISTIDKFFQQTMRAFTREMGLSGGYKLEFDYRGVLSQIIDLMIFDLDRPEKTELAGWVLEFMRSEIRDSRQWNVKKSIERLAQELSNEEYKVLSNKSRETSIDKATLKSYRQQLMKIIAAWENEMKSVGKRALSIMSAHELSTDDFKYGKTSTFGMFTHLANGVFKEPTARFLSRLDNLEDWSTAKSTRKAEIEKAYHSGLNACFADAIALFENSVHYQTAKSIIRNFYTLGILSDVQEELRNFQKENNTLFLSDTTELLNRIIADSDTPFVYEKTGTRVQNYMIDEFQDTSSLQWHNFRPLINESLSSGYFNLVVGDVKQSIYRWRNSDWKLLEHQIGQDFNYHNISEVVLGTNWRSDANIVLFNNELFKVVASVLQDVYNKEIGNQENSRIEEAYQHVYQLVSPRKKDSEGEVKMTFFDTSDSERDWKEEALNRLPSELEEYQRQGFALRDIAILVRKNSEAVEVAEFLLQYKEDHPNSEYRYDIISNEALVIGNAQSVKAAVALLRYLQNRNDDTMRLMAVHEYYRFLHHFTSQEALSLFFDSNQLDFPDAIKSELDSLSVLPFYEMVETFFSINNHVFDDKENVYVQAFLDIVLQFSSESSSSTNDFLEWWDDKGKDKTLFTPDSQDAIRLMTIHKSKGLGFDVVIVPFMDWKLESTGLQAPILWCEPQEEPFSQLPFVPLQYSPSLANTIFKEDFFEEKLMSYIDNINLIYVAFTRAKKRIIAFAPQAKSKRVNTISSLVLSAIMQNKGTNEDVSLSDFVSEGDDEITFYLGKADKHESSKASSGQELLSSGRWNTIPFDNRLNLRLNSKGFFSEDGSRAYGTLMHDIMSEVKTIDEVTEAVQARYNSGELSKDEQIELTNQLTRILSNPPVSTWYSGQYKVMNEQQILLPSSTFNRPDRVMIDNDNKVVVVDYKFGEVKEKKYEHQVKRYLQAINQMGYKSTVGYIFYVTLNEIEEVILDISH